MTSWLTPTHMVKMKCMVMHECVKGQNYVANDWLTSMYKIYVYYLHYDLHIVHNYKCETLRGMYWKLIWWTHTPIECLCVEVSFPPSLILSSPAGMVLLLWKGIWSEVPSSFICLGRSSSLPSSFCFWKVHSVNRKLEFLCWFCQHGGECVSLPKCKSIQHRLSVLVITMLVTTILTSPFFPLPPLFAT